MRRAERGASLGMPFRVPRQVAISSERRSFEPAGVKRNHTDLHIMIYILVLCLLCSFSSRRPCLPSTTHHGLDSSSLLSLPLYLSSLSLSLSLHPSRSLILILAVTLALALLRFLSSSRFLTFVAQLEPMKNTGSFFSRQSR